MAQVATVSRRMPTAGPPTKRVYTSDAGARTAGLMMRKVLVSCE